MIVPQLYFLTSSRIFVYISVYFCIFLYNLGIATFSSIIWDYCVFFEYVRKTRENRFITYVKYVGSKGLSSKTQPYVKLAVRCSSDGLDDLVFPPKIFQEPYLSPFGWRLA
eukprot:UN01214